MAELEEGSGHRSWQAIGHPSLCSKGNGQGQFHSMATITRYNGFLSHLGHDSELLRRGCALTHTAWRRPSASPRSHHKEHPARHRT